jgi:hypothetical protein
VPPRPTSPDGHRRQARRNAQLAAGLSKLANVAAQQWAAIVAFYAALHWVDSAILARAGSRPADHDERNRVVEQIYQLIDDDYKRLYQRSRALRYDLEEPRPGELERLLSSLERIRLHLEQGPLR